MSALLEALRLHKPIPPTKPAHSSRRVDDTTVDSFIESGRLAYLQLDGAEFVVLWDSEPRDDDGPALQWVDAVQVGGVFFWAIEVCSAGMRDALDEALAKLVESAQ